MHLKLYYHITHPAQHVEQRFNFLSCFITFWSFLICLKEEVTSINVEETQTYFFIYHLLKVFYIYIESCIVRLNPLLYSSSHISSLSANNEKKTSKESKLHWHRNWVCHGVGNGVSCGGGHVSYFLVSGSKELEAQRLISSTNTNITTMKRQTDRQGHWGQCMAGIIWRWQWHTQRQRQRQKQRQIQRSW